MYDVTYNEILERTLSRVSDKFDKREGSIIFDTCSPVAYELQLLYIELNTLISEMYGDSASREFLIRRCKERGIEPYEATHAILKGKFTPINIDVTGQRFNIGSVNFIATEKITDGEYQMQCETPGIVGNQQMGIMIPIDYIEGLETAEITELLVPGKNEEETEDLRTRYFDSFKEKSFGGNVKDYLEKTLAIPGVGACKVSRVWNDNIRPKDLIPTPNVDIWYETVAKSFSGNIFSWISAVYKAASEKKLTTGGTVLLTILNSDFDAASEDLISKVQSEIDPEDNPGEGFGLAPIGHVVTVKSAAEKLISINCNVTFEDGYGWTNLQALIIKAVSDYFSELKRSWANSQSLVVRISRIESSILSIEGVLDINGAKLNGGEENIILDKYEIPVVGGIGE